MLHCGGRGGWVLLRSGTRVERRSERGFFRHQRWNRFVRWQDVVRDNEAEDADQTKMRRYLAGSKEQHGPGSLYLTPEKPEDALPRKPVEEMDRREQGMLPFDFVAGHAGNRYLDYSVDNRKRFRRYQDFLIRQYDQRLIAERYLFLGADLAAAHFLVYRGAAVKFLGDDRWYKRGKGGNYDKLPGVKVAGLYVEAIDASNTQLMFEGFDNLQELQHLRMLRLSGCPYMTDWVMGRLTAFEDTLEYLDLSGCTRLSAKGLMGVRVLKKLKYLRLEGLDDVADIGQAALLLEEAIPGLQILGVDYGRALNLLDAEMQLLANDRVLHDAKGNIHLEDDNGALYYVAGNKLEERTVVDDDDKPLMLSSIRRDVPAMSDAELEQMERLTGGKLRHLLIGSPSGYSWSEEVHRTLSFEAEYKQKEGRQVHSFMQPDKLTRPLRPDKKRLPEQKVSDTSKSLLSTS